MSEAFAIDRPDGDRAQLLLVTAIVIGMIIVGTVVLLNGIRFTEHTGNDNTLRAAQEADWTTDEIRDGLQSVVAVVESDGAPYVTTNATFDGRRFLETNVTALNQTYMAVTSHSGNAFVTLTLDRPGSVEGTVLRQDAGTYQSKTGAADWTLASDATVLPYVHLNVSDQSTASGAAFTVGFADDAGRTVDLRFTDTNVVLDDGSTRQLCSGSTAGEHVAVTVAERAIDVETTAAGVTCRGASVDLGSPATLSFENGDVATGSFLATVGPAATVSSSHFRKRSNRASGDPYYWGTATPASGTVIVNPAVSLQYDTSAIQYSTQLLVMGRNLDT